MALHETQTDFLPNVTDLRRPFNGGRSNGVCAATLLLTPPEGSTPPDSPSRLIKFPESAFYQSDRQRSDRTYQAADAISVSLSEEPGTAVTIRNFLAIRNYDAIKVSHLRYTRYL